MPDNERCKINKERTCARAFFIILGHPRDLGLVIPRNEAVLTAEVVEADVCIIDAQRMEQVEDGLGHHRRTAEVVLDILGSIMLLEVGVAHNRSDEARGVLDS